MFTIKYSGEFRETSEYQVCLLRHWRTPRITFVLWHLMLLYFIRQQLPLPSSPQSTLHGKKCLFLYIFSPLTVFYKSFSSPYMYVSIYRYWNLNIVLLNFQIKGIRISISKYFKSRSGKTFQLTLSKMSPNMSLIRCLNLYSIKIIWHC